MKLLGALVGILLVLALLVGPGRDPSTYAVWWLTNTQPPEVSLVGPPGGIRAAFDVVVQGQPAGRLEVAGADVDGRAVPPALNLKVDTTGLPDGDHTLSVRVQDTSLRHNSTTAALKFSSDNTPPVFDLQTTPPSVAQGHTAVIYVRPNEPAEAQVSLGGLPLHLFPAGVGYWAVVGVDPDQPPGAQDLVVDGHDVVGNPAQARGSLTIAPYKFTQDSIQLPPTIAALLAPSIRAAEDAQLGAYYQRDNGPPLWKGAFIPPVNGPVSTEFGEVRSYNGRPFEGHHGGTDFAVGMGQNVLAPARGRALFRGTVQLRGNVLILDHGGGVYTTYAHLADWLVTEGQEVQAGQPIAKVGTTGLSTGPHLHWELWVGGKNVDPLEWTQREIP